MLLALLLAASPAAKLNTEGFRLYQQQHYAEALSKFVAAVRADESHALSHYNLAATLGLLRAQGKICEYDAYQSTILEHLETAVRLDERRRARMKVDKDFDSVRDTLRYQLLAGLSPAREKDVVPIVVAVTWTLPAVGAYGNPLTLDFSAGGTFALKLMQLTDDGPRIEVVKGRWTAKGFQLTLDFEQAVEGQRRAVGQLTPEGHLVFEKWDLSDSRSDCDA